MAQNDLQKTLADLAKMPKDEQIKFIKALFGQVPANRERAMK